MDFTNGCLYTLSSVMTSEGTYSLSKPGTVLYILGSFIATTADYAAERW